MTLLRPRFQSPVLNDLPYYLLFLIPNIFYFALLILAMVVAPLLGIKDSLIRRFRKSP